MLPLLVGEIEWLQPRECPHHAAEGITDSFLVIGDAHGLIHLQDPGSDASFIQKIHQLLVTIGFEGLGHRPF